MADKLTDKEIKELKKIQKEIKDPATETKIVPLVKNIYKSGGKQVNQYKINVPKKFADFLEFDKKKIKVEVVLDKENHKITFEVSENC
ncbi:hypothetical protein K8R30_03525 [archaeon]|nr:hypothetical protein [archaeon]